MIARVRGVIAASTAAASIRYVARADPQPFQGKAQPVEPVPDPDAVPDPEAACELRLEGFDLRPQHVAARAQDREDRRLDLGGDLRVGGGQVDERDPDARRNGHRTGPPASMVWLSRASRRKAALSRK